MKRYIFLLVTFMIISKLFSQEAYRSNEINRRFDATLFPDSISSIEIYSKEDCGRCETVINLLNTYQINYTKFDLGEPEIYSAIDIEINKSLPHKDLGYAIGFPIIKVNNIIFFNLENHHDFVVALKEYLEK